MTDIKLSTAIREGAKLHPQGFEDYTTQDGDPDASILCTCVLGAAGEYFVTKEKTTYDPQDIWNKGSELYEAPEYQTRTRCPLFDTCGHVMPLADIVTVLNDDHRWTREAIADWLDSLGY